MTHTKSAYIRANLRLVFALFVLQREVFKRFDEDSVEPRVQTEVSAIFVS